MPYDTPIKDVAQALRYLAVEIDLSRAIFEVDVACCSREATLELLGPACVRDAAARARDRYDSNAQASEARIARLRELRDLLVTLEGSRDE